MSHRLILFRDREMRLTVFITPRRVSPPVKKVFCLLEILTVACSKVKLRETHFCYLMPGHLIELPFAGTESIAHTVGITNSYIEEVSLPCCLIMGDCSLRHMTEVIELMT